MSDTFQFPLSEQLRGFALAWPGTTEGDSCVNRAFKAAGRKNFLFLGEKAGQIRMMVKLVEHADQARALHAEGPWSISVGKAGWCTALFAPDAHPDPRILQAWIEESFRLVAPKRLLARLDG